MDIPTLFYEVFKKIGFYQIFMSLGKISWFIFPFLLWWKIYLLYPIFFNINIVYIIGFILNIIIFLYVFLTQIELINYDEKINESITKVNITLNDSANKGSDKMIREECSKFVVPYLYSNKLIPTGLGNYINIRGYRGAIIELFIYFYLTLSLIPIIAYFKSNIIYMLSNIANNILYIGNIFFMIEYNYNYILFNLVSLSILYCIFLKIYIGEYNFNKKIILLFVIVELITLPFRLWAISNLLLYPIRYYSNKKYVKYTPFIFPSYLPNIIYQAADNIGLKNPKISKFEYNVKSVEDVVVLKKIIEGDKHISGIFKMFIRFVNEHVALNNILHLDPEFILCLSNGTCNMHGSIIFDPSVGVRTSTLYFKNQFLQEEFIKIAETEIMEQRKMKPLIPSDLNSLLDRAKIKGDEYIV